MKLQKRCNCAAFKTALDGINDTLCTQHANCSSSELLYLHQLANVQSWTLHTLIALGLIQPRKFALQPRQNTTAHQHDHVTTAL